MAINFKQLVESQLVIEQFDPNKTFKENVETILKHVYPDSLLGGIVSRNDLYFKYFAQYGANIQSGGSTYIADDFLRNNRFFWPIIDTSNKILNGVNNKTIFNNLVTTTTKSFDQVITSNYQDPNDANQVKQSIENYLDILAKLPAGQPQNYIQFSNYRLQKLNSDLSQLTVQKYNNLTILNAIIEIALQRGIKDKTIIEKVLTYPVDYLSGRVSIPEKFDTEIINIGGQLLTYFKTTLEAAGVPPDQLNNVGSISGSTTQYGKEYAAFIKGNSTLPALQKINNLGALQSAAPNVYTKIQEYTIHIKKGDKPSGWQIAGNIMSGALKGLEDIGTALSRF